MSINMLGGLPLSEFQGPRDDFEQKLAGKKSTTHSAAVSTNRFSLNRPPASGTFMSSRASRPTA